MLRSFMGHSTRDQFGRLGLARESATTVPTATAVPTTILTRIRIARARRCFAGAIAAPTGLEAVTPVTVATGAAAVPTGFVSPFGN
jgi:hypothetical protein